MAKYWGDEIQHKRHLRVVELYEHFVEHKARQVGARTLEKYRGLAHHLEQFFKQQSASSVTSTKAAAFVEKLAQRLQPITVKERLVMMKSCWEWGITQRVADDNPWAELRVKVPPKQRARPFSPTEVKAILQGFRTHAHYSYYADYVEFLLTCGCRPGETVSLRWKHVSEDCSQAWIGESWSRGEQNPTKNNQSRVLRFPPRIQQMLKRRRPAPCDANALVFPAKEGGHIDDHNFRNRAWKSILAEQGIEYRKPYTTRHTGTSNMLQVLHPTTVAEITGHHVRTLYEHYAGNISTNPEIPDLWED
ncbi:MAG: site-specific integrase [Elainellaceae cyanobacterium]